MISGAAMALCSGAHLTVAQADEADSSGLRLEEIVVTAERRATNLQQTALSVVVESREDLIAKGITDIGDLARFTPGLNVSGNNDPESLKPVFTIRGIGQPSGRESIERGVGLYVDDLYLPRTNGSLLQLLDVANVEVLRGPQGTLFGRNSSGGAIRYITNKPSDQFLANFTATAGAYDRQDVTGLVNIPLSDRLFVRAQAGDFRRDGYVNLVGGPVDAKAGNIDNVVSRIAVRYQPTDALTIDATGSYSLDRRDRPPTVITALNTTDALMHSLSTLLVNEGQPALTANDPRFVYAGGYTANGNCYVGVNTLSAQANGRTVLGNPGYCDYGQRQSMALGSLAVDWSLSPSLTLRSVSGWVDSITRSSTPPAGVGAARFTDFDDDPSASQEIQLKYASRGLHVVGGLYYFYENPLRQQNNQLLTYAPPFSSGLCCSGSLAYSALTTHSYGVFTQADVALTDKLSVTGGVRYSSDHKSIAAYQTDRPAVEPGTEFFNHNEWSSTDYRATLQYQWLEELMTYITASTGYKSGSFNDEPGQFFGTSAATLNSAAVNGGVTAFDPEKVRNYEAGVRSQFFDNRVRLNLTGFYMKYSDMQITAPVISVNPPSVFQGFSNVGRMHLYGWEGELVFKATTALSLNAAVSNLRQGYDALADGNGLLIASTCSQLTPAGLTSLQYCRAQPLAGAPQWQYSFAAQYALPLGQAGDLALSAAFAYTDSTYSGNSSSTGNLVLPAFGLLNMRAQYAPQRSNWSVALFGTNLTNRYYLTAAQNGFGFFGYQSVDPGRPREWGLEVSVHF